MHTVHTCIAHDASMGMWRMKIPFLAPMNVGVMTWFFRVGLLRNKSFYEPFEWKKQRITNNTRWQEKSSIRRNAVTGITPLGVLETFFNPFLSKPSSDSSTWLLQLCNLFHVCDKFFRVFFITCRLSHRKLHHPVVYFGIWMDIPLGLN